MTVNPTDKFLVNRSGSSYHVEQQDLMAQLEDDDLLLVNRNSKSYKITGAEFKGSLSSPPIIQSVTLTEDDPDGARFTSQDFTTTAVMLDNGNPASTKSIRGWVEGTLGNVDNAKKYLNLDASLNVIGLTDDDSYTRTPANTITPKISFPATLDNGEAPDTALPVDTSIQTEFKAENTAGSDEMASNVVTPSPSCISGPITTDEIVDVRFAPPATTYDNKSYDTESKLLSGPNASYSSGTTLGTNNNVGSAPPDSGNAAYWLFFDLKIQCAVTIGRTVPNTPSTAVLWGSNDPDGSWTYVNTGKYGDLREVSGAGYRYYAYSRTDNTTVGPDDLSITNGPNVYFPTSSPGLPVLAFASDKDLAKLQPGDEINQEDSAASGTVGSVNVAGNFLTLSETQGAWGPDNDGHYAIGPDYVCPPITLDADDPDDVEKFYAIKAALVQYESERIDFQQLMVDALVAAGFTTDQIAAYIDE